MINEALYKEFIIRSIKIFDIGYAVVGYFLLAIITIYIFNKIYGKFDKEKEMKKSTQRLVFEVLFKSWLIGVVSYFARNIFPLIPFPFDNIYGFDHTKVKEIINGAFFPAFVITFDTYYRGQILILVDRFS